MPAHKSRRLALSVVAATLLVSGCSNQDTPPTSGSAPTANTTAGSSSASRPASSTTSTPTPSSASATPSTASPSRNAPTTKVIAVTFKNGKVKPAADRVDVPRGARVSLKVTSDVADEMHVHGYDRFADLKPDRTTTLSFKANQKGLFEVEAENAATVLVRLLVR